MLVLVLVAALPSPGCTAGLGGAPSLGIHSLHVRDPNLGRVTREYQLQGGSAAGPLPVVFYFHGWCEDWRQSHGAEYGRLAKKHGFLAVYPKGSGDVQPGQGGYYSDESAASDDDFLSWNVGPTTWGNDTCTDACEPTVYRSCAKLGHVGACSTFTCYDDAAFVQQLLTHLGSQYCLDLGRVYATGASNGGMLMSWLPKELPTTFAAVVPVYGLPLKGGIAPNPSVSVLHIHDRQDKEIPLHGGVSGDFYVYEPLSAVLSAWAEAHGCQDKRRHVATPWDGEYRVDGKPARMRCEEFVGCTGRVGRCLYDGYHGSWPLHVEELTWWWVQGLSRPTVTVELV